MEEPFTPMPRPCSTPHSAPAAWLNASPEHGRSAEQDDTPRESQSLAAEEQRQQDIDAFLAAYERIAPAAERRDGWTPFLRRMFLQVIAETGKVSLACEWTGMSRSSAYALQARDRVFAAGWDAASHLRRKPLEDDTFEKGMDGVTESITRSDGVVITRQRYDSRLSMAVLNRLDRRCDRAEERGSVHLAAVRNWDEYLKLVGQGDDQAAEALLDGQALNGVEGARHCPACPLPEEENPTALLELLEDDASENVWKDEDGTWMTSFPPPPGFDGYESGPWDPAEDYERQCTADEAELLEADDAIAEAEENAEMTLSAEAERDGFFGRLAQELASLGKSGTGADGSPEGEPPFAG